MHGARRRAGAREMTGGARLLITHATQCEYRNSHQNRVSFDSG